MDIATGLALAAQMMGSTGEKRVPAIRWNELPCRTGRGVRRPMASEAKRRGPLLSKGLFAAKLLRCDLDAIPRGLIGRLVSTLAAQERTRMLIGIKADVRIRETALDLDRLRLRLGHRSTLPAVFQTKAFEDAALPTSPWALRGAFGVVAFPSRAG